MPTEQESEEKYPLLLLLVDEGKNSGKGRIAFDKNRYKGITSGVTTVFTQLPSK